MYLSKQDNKIRPTSRFGCFSPLPGDIRDQTESFYLQIVAVAKIPISTDEEFYHIFDRSFSKILSYVCLFFLSPNRCLPKFPFQLMRTSTDIIIFRRMKYETYFWPAFFLILSFFWPFFLLPVFSSGRQIFDGCQLRRKSIVDFTSDRISREICFDLLSKSSAFILVSTNVF